MGLEFGDTVRCRVTSIDAKRDQLYLSCRVFNAAGHRPGDHLRGEITGIRIGQAWVRLPGGETAWIPLNNRLDQERVDTVGVGGSLPVRIADVDPARNRIAASLDVGGRTLSFGDDSAVDTPFAKLRDAPGRSQF